jgi:hypothetical protein
VVLRGVHGLGQCIDQGELLADGRAGRTRYEIYESLSFDSLSREILLNIQPRTDDAVCVSRSPQQICLPPPVTNGT